MCVFPNALNDFQKIQVTHTQFKSLRLQNKKNKFYIIAHIINCRAAKKNLKKKCGPDRFLT